MSNVTLEQVMKAYDYATSLPFLRGTTNWCAAVAYSLNEQLAKESFCQDGGMCEDSNIKCLACGGNELGVIEYHE